MDVAVDCVQPGHVRQQSNNFDCVCVFSHRFFLLEFNLIDSCFSVPHSKPVGSRDSTGLDGGSARIRLLGSIAFCQPHNAPTINANERHGFRGDFQFASGAVIA